MVQMGLGSQFIGSAISLWDINLPVCGWASAHRLPMECESLNKNINLFQKEELIKLQWKKWIIKDIYKQTTRYNT